ENLLAVNEATHPASILLREKSFWRGPEKVAIQANGSDGDQQNQKLVPQHPAERNVVYAKQAVESTFESTVKTAVFLRIVSEETGAQHRRCGKRNQQRDDYGHAENHRK